MYELQVFAHPFHGHQGQIIDRELIALNVIYIYRADIKEFSIEKLEDFFAYRIVGKIIKYQIMYNSGSFHIKLDEYLPGDLKESNYVSFECDRFDLNF